jgi:hypothetical protein
MSARQGFSTDQARQIGEQIGLDWAAAAFDVEQFRRGLVGLCYSRGGTRMSWLMSTG